MGIRKTSDWGEVQMLAAMGFGLIGTILLIVVVAIVLLFIFRRA